MSIKLLVGLSNPGDAYRHTRHNAGLWVIEALALKHNLVFHQEKKFKSMLATWRLEDNTLCHVLQSTTFMNLSGQPVRDVCQFYRILPEEILIIHDDLDLAPGRFKLKSGGGHGGHNGVRDVMEQLGQAQFHRLRVGIGHPGHKSLVLDYVLGTPAPADKEAIRLGIEHILPSMPQVLLGNFNELHHRLTR